MAEYIDRKELLKHSRKVHAEDWSGAYWDYAVLSEDIKKTPAADVKKAVYGKWEELECGEGVFDYYFRCSNCKGNTPPRAYPTAPDFCPNCGADMRGSA